MPDLQRKETTHRRRKQGKVVKEDSRYISWAHRDNVRKAKVEMQLRFARTSQATRISMTTSAVNT